MPIYEYKCNQCGNRFDALRSIDAADTPISCDACRSKNTKRVLSNFFAHSAQGSLSTGTKDCGSCSGTSCSSCGL